jgi:hypothetical protein
MRVAGFWLLLAAGGWWLHEDGASISRYQGAVLILMALLVFGVIEIGDLLAAILRRLPEDGNSASGE